MQVGGNAQASQPGQDSWMTEFDIGPYSMSVILPSGRSSRRQPTSESMSGDGKPRNIEVLLTCKVEEMKHLRCMRQLGDEMVGQHSELLTAKTKRLLQCHRDARLGPIFDIRSTCEATQVGVDVASFSWMW